MERNTNELPACFSISTFSELSISNQMSVIWSNPSSGLVQDYLYLVSLTDQVLAFSAVSSYSDLVERANILSSIETPLHQKGSLRR